MSPKLVRREERPLGFHAHIPTLDVTALVGPADDSAAAAVLDAVDVNVKDARAVLGVADAAAGIDAANATRAASAVGVANATGAPDAAVATTSIADAAAVGAADDTAAAAALVAADVNVEDAMAALDVADAAAGMDAGSTTGAADAIGVVNATGAPDAVAATTITPGAAAATVSARGEAVTQPTRVVSSWVLFHMPGNQTAAVGGAELPHLVSGVQEAVADALRVCRSLVSIMKLRALSTGLYDKSEYTGMSVLEEESLRDARIAFPHHGHRRAQETTIVTQMMASYEIRLEESMQVKERDIMISVNRLQLFSRLQDFSNILWDSFQRNDPKQDDIMLDDVGIASSMIVRRPPLSRKETADCEEEIALRRARISHSRLLLLAAPFLMLTMCAGSLVFAAKNPSRHDFAPSRFNPLSAEMH